MEDENNTNMELKLLKEAIWNIEDKLNVILEAITEHDAELIRLRQLTNLCLKRLVRLETQRKKRCKGGWSSNESFNQ